MTFNIITFGCKVNQCESEDICASMIQRGFSFESNLEDAKIIIINSCTVTAESDRKLRQTINRVKRVNKACIVVLTGCMPQAEPDIASKIEGIDIVLGNRDKMHLPSIIENYLKNPHKVLKIEPIKSVVKFEKSIVNHSPNRSRAFLKIQDGCNRFCSYCIIPYARGRVRSKPLEQIEKDVGIISANGYKEIVLVGINLSSYGMDIGCNLYDAVSIIAKFSGIERIRLGSLEPDLMTDELIDKLSREPKICPQFHLSLQSGSDRILKSMRRRYTRQEYLDVINKLRVKFKNATFTTDIMVGFPDETESDFEDTLKIIGEAKFLKVHVFPYSPRPNTPAADMKNQIDKSIKSQRVKKVIEISENCSRIVLEGFLGNYSNVLYETVDKNGLYEGYTPNYILVKSSSSEDIRGKIVETYLSNVKENFVQGLFKQSDCE